MGGITSAEQAIQNLQAKYGGAVQGPAAGASTSQAQETANFSDTTASAGGSDDEGTMASI